MTTTRAFVVATVLLAAVPSFAATTQESAHAEASLSDHDVQHLDYRNALDHARASLSLDPSGVDAAAMTIRVDTLSAYVPFLDELARLDAVRLDPARADDRAAIESIEHDATSFHARVRDDALLFVAEAWNGRLHEPARAVTPALVLARDPAADPIVRARAFEIALDAELAVGAIDDAVDCIAHDPSAPAVVVKRLQRARIRRGLHRASWVAVATALAAFVVAVEESCRRRRTRIALAVLLDPLSLAFVAAATVGSTLLAEVWHRGDGSIFVAFGGALLCAHLLVSAWRGGFGDRSMAARIVGAVVGVASIAGAAYLLVEQAQRAGGTIFGGGL